MKCYQKDYPRPQHVRKGWTSLNGSWDFMFDEEGRGRKEGYQMSFPEQALTIQVPYTYETRLSGIGREEPSQSIWYHRILTEEALGEEERLLLHFEGSDFVTHVWVNGQYVGNHRGGYARFSFDITEYVLPGENHLTVQVEDSLDQRQPRGKQRWLKESYACWYVQTTGIWKTVWTERVPVIRLEREKITPILQENLLKLEIDLHAPRQVFGADLQVEVTVSFDGEMINKVCSAALSDQVTLLVDMTNRDKENFVWDVRTWSPQEPNLYDLDLVLRYKGLVVDQVGSYCAMREVRIENANILLNGRPLYQRLILDQGYWEDSHLTAPDEEALIEDIEKIMLLGYNGVRKHQKIEDERFLYWCDVKGLLVWSEAPAAYAFSDDAVQEFATEWMQIVRQNYNHPCIITWVPFNESWGIGKVMNSIQHQRFTEAIYNLTRSLDGMRPVVANDGWEHTVSDILTLHDYQEEGDLLRERYIQCKEEILSGKVYHNDYKSAIANGYAYRGQPVIISEFGGIAFQNEKEGWG
ncbi:MAG: glycoside hydrolase family 2, partial [Blautia sp.]|nr:glycoside hydrolase family 2 [Blautia sp.]